MADVRASTAWVDDTLSGLRQTYEHLRADLQKVYQSNCDQHTALRAQQARTTAVEAENARLCAAMAHALSALADATDGDIEANINTIGDDLADALRAPQPAPTADASL